MKVTQEDKIKFNQLYYETKNYAEVSRRTGFSASTIRKYVDKNYVPPIKEKTKFEQEIPEEPFEKLKESDNWGEYTRLSDEEVKFLKLLWKEIEG